MFGDENFWYSLGVGWVMEREGVNDEMVGVTNGRSSSQSLDQLALMLMVFQRISNQMKSFSLVYRAVKTTINNQGVVWVYGNGH